MAACMAMKAESKSQVITWPAPAGETPSTDYEVTVNGTPLFVWTARVREQIDKSSKLWTHKFGGAAESASFVLFDFNGTVAINVKPKRPFRTATLHPVRCGIKPTIADGVIHFQMSRPSPLTLMLDGQDERPLHLFANSPETDIPQKGDPNVIYFGPGVHEIHGLEVHSGQTVYVAGGAIVKARLRDGETGTYSERHKIQTYPGGMLQVKDAGHVRICGRGILDCGLIPHLGWQMIQIANSHDIRVSGITLRDAPNWNIRIYRSHDVTVEGVRIISGRINSDGINSVNSVDVRIRGCFVRNHDDSIAVKASSPDGECARITAEDCVIWNDWGYALGVTYETRAPIHDILFRNCAIIFVRHWAMGIHVVDAGTVNKVRFEDIDVEDLALAARRFGDKPLLIRLDVTKDVWATDAERGHIRDITFRNISLTGKLLPNSEISGFDASHCVERVGLDNLTLLDRHVRRAEDGGFRLNQFTHDIEFR